MRIDSTAGSAWIQRSVVGNYHKLQSDLESDGADVQRRSCFIFIFAREKPADLYDCVVVLQLRATRADVPARNLRGG